MALNWKEEYFLPTVHIFLVTREKLQNFLQTHTELR